MPAIPKTPEEKEKERLKFLQSRAEAAKEAELKGDYMQGYEGVEVGGAATTQKGEYMKGFDQYKQDRGALDAFADDTSFDDSPDDVSSVDLLPSDMYPEVSDQVASTAKEVAQQPIDTKQLIADTKALVEKARGLGQPSEAPSSNFAGGLDYGKDYQNPLKSDDIENIIKSAPDKITTQQPRETGSRPARPENIESAGQVFKNFYDLNQRTEGRKDFAASLDAAGYDPSTASAEDKAKFYAQGKELGLSSEQIDKYRNDKITAAADLKYRRENPREFIRREANQFGARGGLGGARGLGGGSRPISGMGDSNIRMSKADQDKQERRRRAFG